MEKKKKIIAAAAAVSLLAGAMAGVYLKFAPRTQDGVKAVSIEVIDDKGESVEYQVTTDGVYLIDAMEAAEQKGMTFEGTDGAYGLTVDTVNGLKADYNVGSDYWAFYVNGEYCNYGPDRQPVADGDAFKIEYSVWDEAS